MTTPEFTADAPQVDVFHADAMHPVTQKHGITCLAAWDEDRDEIHLVAAGGDSSIVLDGAGLEWVAEWYAAQKARNEELDSWEAREAGNRGDV